MVRINLTLCYLSSASLFRTHTNSLSINADEFSRKFAPKLPLYRSV